MVTLAKFFDGPGALAIMKPETLDGIRSGVRLVSGAL